MGDDRMFIGCYEDDRKSGLVIYLWADCRSITEIGKTGNNTE